MTLPTLADSKLQLLLSEDAPYGDLTTEALDIGGARGEISFLARQSMVACSTEEAARLFELCGALTTVHAATGSRVATGDELLTARGPASALLLAWKVAQNLVEWTSGIASAAARLVAAVRQTGLDVPVACTRKAFPGTHYLSSKAVVAGGATMHRLGLSESLLVFPEHRVFLPPNGLNWLGSLRARERERRLTVEVTTSEQACTFAAAGAEALQLEHFSPEAVAECRRLLHTLGLRPLLLAAGGVNESNAAAYARAGADVLVSSAPYQAGPADVKVVVSRSSGDER